MLSRVKLIAEPWDVGEGGYQVGNFPPRWCEWNGKYRDTVRDYWRGEAGHARRVRAAGSPAARTSTQTTAGVRTRAINFVTAHDGFTLRDLVSYNEKHNEANGEDNRDGESHNRSWNCGAEGPTDDPAINALRARQQRNFLATLFLSQGVPMLLGGDELGRTQQGNNNAYCQDNEISWFDWEHADDELLEFTRRRDRTAARAPGVPAPRLVPGPAGCAARGVQRHRVAHARRRARCPTKTGTRSTRRHSPSSSTATRCATATRTGGAVRDDSFLLLFNAHDEALSFTMPAASVRRVVARGR